MLGFLGCDRIPQCCPSSASAVRNSGNAIYACFTPRRSWYRNSNAKASWLHHKIGSTTYTANTLRAASVEKQLTTTDAVTKEAFPWTKYWYPVTLESYLDDSKPNAVKLFGKDLVLWKDNTGLWHAFEDKCPHRLAPLSEGILQGGDLVCMYHGWRMGGDGQVTHIPAATSSSACRSLGLCATTYPLQVSLGLVWVWPESGAQAFIDSAASSPHVVPQLEDEGWYPAWDNWQFSELPNSYEVWLEQWADPAHAPHLHTLQMGFRTNLAVPMELKLEGPITSSGFSLTHGPYMSTQGNMKAVRHFLPPNTTTFEYTYDDGRAELHVLRYCPIGPFRVRNFYMLFTRSPPVSGWRLRQLPVGVMHGLFDLLDQDTLVMCGQERYMEKHSVSWKEYKLATAADRGIGAVREWMSKYGDMPYQGSEYATPVDRAASQDRYDRHTKHCSHCKKTVKNLDWAVNISKAIAVAALALAVAQRQLLSIPSVVAVLFGLASVACSNFRKRYFSPAIIKFQNPEGPGWLDGKLEALLLVVVGTANGLLQLVKPYRWASEQYREELQAHYQHVNAPPNKPMNGANGHSS